MGTHSSAATCVGEEPSTKWSVGSLSKEGSLLNISAGTVAGARSGIKSMTERLDNCRSTSAWVCWFTPTTSNWLKLGFCTCSMDSLLGVGCKFFFLRPLVEPVAEPLTLCSSLRLWKCYRCLILGMSLINKKKTYFFISLVASSSEDSSVSSLSEEVFSGFSYCNKRSKRKARSLETLSKRLWFDLKASWKNSFS